MENSRIEVEEAIIGMLIEHPDMMLEANDILRPDDFSTLMYSKLYSILLDLSNTNGVFDILLIENQMKKMGIFDSFGGREKLFELTSNAPITVSLTQYIEILKTYSIQKKIESACIELLNEIKTPEKYNYKDLIDLSQKRIMDIDKDENSIGVTRISDVAKKQVQNLLLLSKSGESSGKGIPTDFKEYDRVTGGLNKSELLILAARPAMGKTAFALNIATNLAKQGKSVLIFSLEMGVDQLFKRILSNISDVEMYKLKNKHLTDFDIKRITDKHEEMKNYNLFISEKAGVSILEIKNIARRFKTQNDLDFIVIDYLQLINSSSKNKSREQEVSEISRSLKNLARELDIPILALSQLSRSVESRSDKRPLLSDLRESGAIEQDADQVMFLFREEYYKQIASKSENKVENEQVQNKETEIAELIIGKHRNGETAVIHLGIDFKYQRFINVHKKF
ncbi:replicative DNA helicase [Oceanivirga miroungae]|uniref:Replicative DNA helicase n=1 Tax=Oceanivirga miroungae TaxID=1130046 RepID=A0A6I8MB95_9FUSO|nr:replicative DNA helicase [Oceanivirga miroungae]VWL85505.1 replicative DNA helicase [Oceanivirga miroungae]